MMDRFPPLLTNATLGGTWFTQMGEAAVAHNVSVQLCMAYSRHVLASLASPSITQVRGMSLSRMPCLTSDLLPRPHAAYF